MNNVQNLMDPPQKKWIGPYQATGSPIHKKMLLVIIIPIYKIEKT